MNTQRAREILSRLCQGVDPTTGEELANDSVLQRADVLRALLAGVSALEILGARAKRRAQLPQNVGRSWDEHEEHTLVAEFKRGDTVAAIAEAHGRTIRAIEARLQRLGLVGSS